MTHHPTRLRIGPVGGAEVEHRLHRVLFSSGPRGDVEVYAVDRDDAERRVRERYGTEHEVCSVIDLVEHPDPS